MGMLKKVVVGTMTVDSAAAVTTGSEMLGVVALLRLLIALAQSYFSGALVQDALAAVTPPGSRRPSRPTTPDPKKN